LEYEEKFNQFWGAEVTHNLLATLLTASNISLHSVYYNFNLVKGDEDDNKFVNLYFSSVSDILVSNDAKLLALNNLAYPPIKVMTLQEFLGFL
jgi:putative PIN family toxin of toxin-antitoxin system